MKDLMFPRPNDGQTCHLKEVVRNPAISVGDYSYYHDFDDPRQFEKNNVIYHYPFVNHDRLVIGKFCSIASGAKFLFNGGNHKRQSFVNYPFAIFNEFWDPALPITASWDNKGDIVIGNDVWIGCEAVIMAGVHVGNGARIGTRAIVTRDVAPYEIVAGMPARPLRNRFAPEVRALLEELRWWDLAEAEIRANLPILMSGDVAALTELVARLRRPA